MKLAEQACAAILFVATFAALAGALLMIWSVYEGDRAGAWLWAGMFFASSAVGAWCFGRLV